MKSLKGIVCFVFFIPFLDSGRIFAQEESQWLCYLDANQKVFSLGDDQNLMTNSGINTNQVYLFGEYHKYKKHFELGVDLLKRMILYDSVSVFAMELSPSDAWIVNYYFKSNKDRISVNRKDYNQFIYSDSNYGIQKHLKESYFAPLRNLFYEKKMQIKPIDIEQDFQKALVVMLFICDSSKSNSVQIQKMDLRIKQKLDRHYTNENLYETVDSLIDEFEGGGVSLEKDMGVLYFDLDGIVKGLKKGLVYDRLSHTFGKVCDSKQFREKCMFNSFLEIVKQNSGKHIFGHFGLTHITNYENDNYYGCIDKSMADMLDSSGIKICRLVGYYPGVKKNENFSFIPEPISKTINKHLKKYEFSILNLHETNTPFKTKVDYAIICR